MVNIEYQEDSTSIDEYLRYCQIIADAFSKALDQNECNVKVVIGIAQEIENQKDEVEELWSLMKPDYYEPPGKNPDIYKDDLSFSVVDVTDQTIPDASVSAIKKKIKDSCFDCDLGWPSIDFNENFMFSFNKLKATLQTYFDAFDKLLNPNFCHAAGAFNFSCLQDILKLITLLLTAYSTILAIRKLSGISLSAFIKGVISGLLGQLLGSVSLQVDLSKTGLSCLLKVFEEIAMQIPDGSTLSTSMHPDLLHDLGLQLEAAGLSFDADGNVINKPVATPYTTSSGETKSQYSETEAVDVTKTEGESTSVPKEVVTPKEPNLETTFFEDVIDSLNLNDPQGKNPMKKFTEDLRRDLEGYEDNISNVFKFINDTVRQATDDFNNTISQLFGLLDYFQCEFARSGTDFIEILEYINRLISVINLLSSIAAVVAKKQVQKLCKTKEAAADFSDVIRDDIELSGFNDLDSTDIIEEFLGKLVEETTDENDNILPIIYDKDVEPMLPKLSLLSCNLGEFIEAHSIDNIIKRAAESVRKDTERERVLLSDPRYRQNPKRDLPSVTLGPENTLDRERWKLYPIQFTPPAYSKDKWIFLTKEEQQDALEKNDNTSYGLQSILDFVYNNPLEKSREKEIVQRAATVDNNMFSSESASEKSYRKSIERPSYSPTGTNKKSFENECRDINDVLSILGNLQG